MIEIQGQSGPIACLVDCHLGAPLRARGWRTVELRPQGPVFDVAAALDEAGVRPDLLIQEEDIGGRTLLLGLERLDCPKLFWAIDVHLNLFWHASYARLFDCLLSSQKAWLPVFRREGLRTEWLPWRGPALDWIPFERRSRDLAFVGHLHGERRARLNMVRFLERSFGLQAFEGVATEAMYGIYADSRLVPNEAILGEINFRLFEAAGAGALVLTPANDELAELYEPGVEVETYDHVLELAAKTRFYLDRPDLAKRIALAGWDRTRREHLASHRAERVLALVRELTASAVRGQDADKAFWLAAQAALHAGRLRGSAEERRELASRLEAELLRLPGDPQVAAALVTLWSESPHPDAASRVMAVLLETLAKNEHPESLELNLAGSMAALRQELFDPAKRFWYRSQESRGETLPAKPESPRELHILWSRELRRLGRPHRAGFAFDPDVHLPASAFECLLMAQRLDPKDSDVVRAMEALLAGARGFESVRVGFLSHLSLRAPDDWRLGLRLGLANLRAFRVEAGAEELAAALERARLAGEEERFWRALAAQDPGGVIGAVLDGPRQAR